jgi:3-phosphoshikimate 1-carboxyvinyltransferase
MHPWPAPHATGPIHAVVSVPGSKSASNRALILAALADGPSRISGLLDARDTRLMIDALRALGTGIELQPDPAEPGNVIAQVTPMQAQGGAITIDAGLAGTVMRFIPAVAALTHAQVTVDGDAQARRRPMAPITEGLRSLGVRVEGDTLPITVHGTGGFAAQSVSIDASTSSQFISALLLAGARDGLTIEHVGADLPSRPHIDLTIAMLADHGIVVTESQPGIWQVPAGPIRAYDRVIEPDCSNAAPFLAAAVVTKGSVRIPHWPLHTTQPGDAIRDILTALGAAVQVDHTGLVVSMSADITGLDIDLSAVGELTPTVAAMLALGTKPSRITGIAHLRGHETDRIAALVHELRHLGGVADELPDGLSLHPAMLHSGIFHSYADHRMATAGAIIGLHVHGISVDDIETTDKTLPNFPARWAAMVKGSGAA